MNKLQPKLRFSNFSEYWKIEPIENYIELFSGIALKSEEISDDNSGIPILRGINITEGFIRHSKEIDKYYLGNTSKIDKYFVKENDLVLGMDGSKVGKNVALIKKEDEDSILIQRVARIRANSKSNIRYIYQQIFSKKFHDFVDIVNTSSGIPHISSQQIKDFKIGFPSLPEQTKIANFLSSVDEKLSLLKEKKSLLEEYKKGIMQKIFNQEIRFKDDNGNDFEDWEIKTLGEVAKFRRGSFPQPYGLSKWYDEINGMPFIQVYDVGSNMLLKKDTKNKISKVGAEQSVFVKKGTLVITIQGSIGRIAKTQYDAYIDRTLLIFQSYNLPINVDFFKYVVFLLFEIEKTKAPGGTIKTITKEVLTDFEVPIPCIEEQTKIANFLSAIDEKIELVSNQIKDTQEYKKGLLQQMFV